MLEWFVREFSGHPIYQVILLFIVASLVLLLIEMSWLMSRAALRVRLSAAHYRFQQLLAPKFFPALENELDRDAWVASARKFPEMTVRRFLEPRILSTEGEVQKKVVNVYVDVGLLDRDLSGARSRWWHRRMISMRRLAFVGGPEHQELILELGKDSHALRVLAVLAIGRMGSDEYIYKVLEGLELPRRLMEQPIL